MEVTYDALKKQLAQARAEIAHLCATLATARRDAMEEAAVLLEQIAVKEINGEYQSRTPRCVVTYLTEFQKSAPRWKGREMSEPKWPKHEASLHIMHNEHKSYYETVEKALESGTYDREDFPDEAEIQKAIESDSVWKIQWYPRTPIGFCVRCAATFERAVEVAGGEDE